MKNIFIILSLVILAFSCEPKGVEKVDATYENGKPAKVSWVDTTNGKSDTLKKVEYYPNGNKKVEGSFKENLRDGKWTFWFKDGKVWSEGSFKKGKSEGFFNVFNEDGTKYMQSCYKNGIPDGCWTFFEKNIKKKEVYFKEDKIIKQVDF
jgi:antitoxin component YwqK of YwqJK toxin-antitoxin module